MAKIHPFLLSGGAGSRLWPLSRESLPKQFLRLVSDRTLFQEAALRVSDARLFEPPSVIASAQHRFLVSEQLGELDLAAARIVLEPCGRSTAPAAAVAALLVEEADPGGLLLLAPADHSIADIDAFQQAVSDAAEAASRGFLCLFGIRPDSPATGYGYIHIGDTLAGQSHACHVEAFVEKPDRMAAEAYLTGGEHLWNSGIFLLPAAEFLSEMERYEPQLLGDAREALRRGTCAGNALRLDREAFERCRSISIDYAVMERTDRLAVIPVDCGWTDVGSWSTLAEMAGRDVSGNAMAGDVLMEGTRNSYFRSEGPLIAAVGVEDLIVVATADAVLVAHRDSHQEVRRIVERLRNGGRDLI